MQAALTNVTDGEIWVATGTYYPTTGIDRAISFQLANCVAIYGGYPTGGGTRDWNANVTTLSGDIGIANDDTDNSYHVVVGDGSVTAIDNRAILDGFVISWGYADGSTPNDTGGGIFNDTSSPTLTHLTITGNFAVYSGGGISNYLSSPFLTNVTITGNSAGEEGGGIENYDNSNPTLINVTITGNSGGFYGGGITNYQSSPILTNVTITGNSAGEGAGIDNYDNSNPTLTNVIIWGNTDSLFNDTNFAISTPIISYSIIQGSGGSDNIGGTWVSTFGTDNGNNKDADPLFVTPLDSVNAPSPAGNFHLKPTSPAIEAGNNSAPNISTTDLDGNPRIIYTTVDMGSYEFSPIDPLTDMTAISTANTCQTDTAVAYGLVALGENGDRDVCTGADTTIVISSGIQCGTSGTAATCDFIWDGASTTNVDNTGLGPLDVTGLNLCVYVAAVSTSGSPSIIFTIYDTSNNTSTSIIDLSSATIPDLQCVSTFTGSANLNNIGAISMQLSITGASSGDSITVGNDRNQGLTPIELIEGSFQIEGNTIVWATAMELENDSFNLYRHNPTTQECHKINESLIPAMGNASYYSYDVIADMEGFNIWLEDLSVFGESMLHGPSGDDTYLHLHNARELIEYYCPE